MNEIPTEHPYRVRWRNSLITRVAILCVLLVLCLLGSVYVITRYYFTEIVEEMQAQTAEIAKSVEVYFEDNPDADFDSLKEEMRREGADLEFEVVNGQTVPTMFTLEHAEDGQINKIGQAIVVHGDRRFLLTVRVALKPQVAIVRAFKNQYLLLLTLGFLVTLGVMVYSIARILRPLSDLSRSCGEISRGHLRNVEIRKSSGEILALENTFNGMVKALKEKELMESNLRQAQRLSALGSLAAGVAHDIRNPLNSIKLLSSHAADNLKSHPGADQTVNQLNTIRKEVDRLEEIVTGFLSLAKERELNPSTQKVDTLLRECAQLLEKDAEARGIRLTAELRAGETELLLDEKQWNRAILNILINALEACPEGGRVRLFSRLTDVACEVEIRDDGQGLSAESAERAFDPYYTTKQSGTGLGLSITRGIIEEHGGTIQLTGREDEGCQVLITMPLKVEAT